MNFPLSTAFIVPHKFEHAVLPFSLNFRNWRLAGTQYSFPEELLTTVSGSHYCHSCFCSSLGGHPAVSPLLMLLLPPIFHF